MVTSTAVTSGRGCGSKHARAMAGAGLANSSARLFSNPAGDYGSMVNERVGAGEVC